jgi:hypothetical protein
LSTNKQHSLSQGAGDHGANQEMKNPPELFDLFMTYSFKNLNEQVAAGNIIVNRTSRKIHTKKRKSAEPTTKLKAKKTKSKDEPVKEGAEGKAPVLGKQMPSTITSFFSTKPPPILPVKKFKVESKDEPVKKGADKAPVLGKQMPSTITSFFSSAPLPLPRTRTSP